MRYTYTRIDTTFVVSEIQNRWLRQIVWIRGSKVYRISKGGVSQKPIIWTQRRIGDGPLAERIMYCLVVLPLIRVRSIVHPDLEILRATEKEIAIFRKFSRVTSGVEMHDLVTDGPWDEILHQCQPTMGLESQRDTFIPGVLISSFVQLRRLTVVALAWWTNPFYAALIHEYRWDCSQTSQRPSTPCPLHSAPSGKHPLVEVAAEPFGIVSLTP